MQASAGTSFAPIKAPSLSAPEVFLGRQPIYDRNLNIFAHELLFRNSSRNTAVFPSGQEATLQVILNTFLEIGLDKVAAGKPIFVNITRSLLTQSESLILPPEQCVLEVLEDIQFDSEIERALRVRKSCGYQIALDDFIYTEALRPMVELADYVKLDVRALGLGGLRKQVSQLRKFRVKLLAEKIDTQEEFRQCKDMGFHYFQGYFLSRPEILKGKRVPVNRMALLSILAKCREADADCKGIAALIGQNASLSYKLLQALNSALYSLQKRVDSVFEAVLFMGLEAVTRLATLLLLSGLNDKPSSYLVIALQRAYMCELLGVAMKAPNKDQFYTVGLLSALDILLDQTLQEAIRPLPLAEETCDALLAHKGPMGRALCGVLAWEKGDWDAVASSGLNPDVLRVAYWRTVPYVEELRQLVDSLPVESHKK